MTDTAREWLCAAGGVRGAALVAIALLLGGCGDGRFVWTFEGFMGSVIGGVVAACFLAAVAVVAVGRSADWWHKRRSRFHCRWHGYSDHDTGRCRLCGSRGGRS